MNFIDEENDNYAIILYGTKLSFKSHAFVIVYTYLTDVLTIVSGPFMMILDNTFVRVMIGTISTILTNATRDNTYKLFIQFMKTNSFTSMTQSEIKISKKTFDQLLDFKKCWSVGKIIALCGHAGSGKSTIADMITKICTVPIYKISFAFKLKMITSLAFDETFDKYEFNKTEKPQGISFTRRELLQETAKFFRNYNPDIFVNILKYVNPDYIYVITDLRFLNEAKYIKSNGGIIVKIVDNKTSEINSSDVLKHEKEVDEIIPDFEIDNTQKKENIIDKVKQVFYDIRLK